MKQPKSKQNYLDKQVATIVEKRVGLSKMRTLNSAETTQVSGAKSTKGGIYTWAPERPQ